MIRNFFVLSPRGDTILAKLYRNDKHEGAHERSHTEALFRKIKFWDDLSQSKNGTDDDDFVESEVASTERGGGGNNNDPTSPSNANSHSSSTDQKPVKKRTGDAPPVLMMPDGFTYFYIKRNGLIFGASSARNVSPNTVLEVS
jgi:AP-4 complex subunit mu-1